jgi:hypothetical protein
VNGGARAGARGGGRELGKRRIAFGEIVGHMEDVGVYVDVNDAPTLEVAKDASPSDLQNIGNVGGRKSRQRAELEAPVNGGGVDAVQEHDVQVRIELQIGRRALHGHDCAALGTLSRARP